MFMEMSLYVRRSVMAILVALISLSCNMGAEAAANITYNASSVMLQQGRTSIDGYLVNSGDVGATVNAAQINVIVVDGNGSHLWSDSCYFQNVGVYVPAGGSVHHGFNIWNDNCRAYNGYIKWDVGWQLFY